MVMSPGTATSRSAARLLAKPGVSALVAGLANPGGSALVAGLATPGVSALVADFAAAEETAGGVAAGGGGGAWSGSVGVCVSDCGSDLATVLGGVATLAAVLGWVAAVLAAVAGSDVRWLNGCHCRNRTSMVPLAMVSPRGAVCVWSGQRKVGNWLW